MPLAVLADLVASGVPVVQPRHGSFPEWIEATGGGLLVEPEDPADLARTLLHLLDHRDEGKLRIEDVGPVVRRELPVQLQQEAMRGEILGCL